MRNLSANFAFGEPGPVGEAMRSGWSVSNHMTPDHSPANGVCPPPAASWSPAAPPAPSGLRQIWIDNKNRIKVHHTQELEIDTDWAYLPVWTGCGENSGGRFLCTSTRFYTLGQTRRRSRLAPFLHHSPDHPSAIRLGAGRRSAAAPLGQPQRKPCFGHTCIAVMIVLY